MVDEGEPGVVSRDEGKHTGRNDLLFVHSYVHTYIHTNLYSAKNRENESEARAQDD